MPPNAALPSDRSVGLLFFVALAAAAGWFAWRAHPAAWACSAASAGMLVLSLVRPATLRPLNRAWMALARWLHLAISPVILAALFFGIITPYALVMRLAGRDVMRRRFESGVHSYWNERTPPGPEGHSLDRQY